MDKPEPFDLKLEEGLPLCCPAFVLEGLSCRAEHAELGNDLHALGEELRGRWSGTTIGEVEGIGSVRASYRAMGIDPTKTRPSSEALLRRVLKGQGLYRINTLVDALNLISLKYLVPFGLYDLDRIVPPVRLRRGEEGEGYPGIGKARVNVAGRPCMADAEGPFGNPTSDSDRTKIVLETTRVLVAPFLPVDTAANRIEEIVTGTADLLRKYAA